MALAAGVVESGSWHRPSIVTGSPGTTLTARVKLKALNSGVVSQLRELMAGTVRTGAAKAARLPGTALFGQVGVASLSLPGHRGMNAVWFVGFRGNVAFAVLAFSRSAAFDPAVTIARRFAASLPGG
jgi:hypothetical protein